MQHIFHLLNVFIGAGFLELVLAAPAPVPQADFSQEPGPFAGIDTPVSTQSATSGNLYGPESLLGELAKPVPVTGGGSAIVSDYPLVNGQEADPKLGLYLDFNSVPDPQPIRGDTGQTQPGPHTYEYSQLNPDVYAPPGTDSGSVKSAKWPMGLSHNRFGTGKLSGFARQENTDQLPSATELAGVDMRLAPHAYRELHWHTANEWSLMLKGSARVATVNEDGQTFIDDVGTGDVWFFPAGVPHSIQALDQGCEFLLVFDNGSFSEDGTALASELFLRNPKSVLSKNLQTPISAFDNIPQDQLYIFAGTPAPANISEQNMTGPAGANPINSSYTYHFSQQEPYVVPGGQVKILDSTVFPAAIDIAVALLTIEPGAMRELHWHLNSDEWNFFIQGSGRITVFAQPESAQTFDYAEGDVGYIPVTNSHYIENTGTDDLIVLEVLRAPRFTDISVAQWLALTPRQVVQDTLHLPTETLENLPKEKTYLKTGNTNLTALAADPNGTAAYETSAPPAKKRSAAFKALGFRA